MQLRKPGFAHVVISAVVLTAVGLATLWPLGTSAGQPGVLDDGKSLLPLAGISLDRAIEIAQGSASGNVDEVDLEYWRGRLVFNVDVGSKDVKVDAATGELLQSDSDD